MNRDSGKYSSGKSIILHLMLFNSHFVDGYVNFMKLKMSDYHHRFVLYRANHKLLNEDDVTYIDSPMSVITDSLVCSLMRDADVIIVSPIATPIQPFLSILSANFHKKMYLHFWDDAYMPLRSAGNMSIFRKIRRAVFRRLQKRLFQRCAGFLFLIDGEYDVYIDEWKMEKKHWTIPVPSDPCAPTIVSLDISKYLNMEPVRNDRTRVQVGHSAFHKNHAEAFDMLKHFMCDVDIVCPLSYGPENRRDEVIFLGRTIFGDHFTAIEERLSLEEYVAFIARNIDVLVFHSADQQGMGNINIAASLGKKLFLRKGTSMWKHFFKAGYILHDSNDIKSMDLNEFARMTHEERETNIKAARSIFDQSNLDDENAWGGFFANAVDGCHL